MRLTWKTYIFLYTIFVLVSTVYSLIPTSQISVYYKIIIHMEKIYLISYFNHFLFIFLELFTLLPLFLFVSKKRYFQPIFWKGFFILRVTNAITNSYYEYGFYSNLLKINPKITIISILISAILILPAYIALFMYAFRQKRLFPVKEQY